MNARLVRSVLLSLVVCGHSGSGSGGSCCDGGGGMVSSGEGACVWALAQWCVPGAWLVDGGVWVTGLLVETEPSNNQNPKHVLS